MKFNSSDTNINNFTIFAKNTDKFSKIEDILYEKYPKYKESVNYFILNENRINKNATLEENNIKNNDTITLTKSISDFD